MLKIKDLQKWVRTDWEKKSKLINHQTEILFLIEEIGELAEAIRKSSAPRSHSDRGPGPILSDLGREKRRKRMKVDLEGEFGDVLISLITLANHYQIDLEEAFLKSKKKIELRHKQGH